MKKRLLNNYGLKLLSIVCAIIFWCVIVNVNDPSDKVTISNIPVTLKNAEILSDGGYIYDVVGGTDRVTIDVKGPRSMIENLKASDFKAQATVTNVFADTVRIEVDCISGVVKDSDISISLRTQDVKLDIQNLVTKTIDVEALITGSPANGYYTDDSLVSISPTTIRISGPENIINQVTSAKVSYDVTGENSEKITMVKPKLYNSEGKTVDISKVTFSKSQVEYKIDILKKKEVNVNFAVTGEVAEGFKYTNISSDVKTVTIAGKENDLAKIFSIDIPASLIDISEITANTSYTINVSQYVPNTVILVSDVDYASVEVAVEKLQKKTVSLLYDEISVKNMNSRYKVEYLDKGVNAVIVEGIQSDIDSFSASDLIATVDLTGLKEGEHSVLVNVTTKKSVEVIGTYKINIRLVNNDDITTSEREE